MYNIYCLYIIKTASVFKNPQLDQILCFAGILADTVIWRTMTAFVVHDAIFINDIPSVVKNPVNATEFNL